MDTISFHVREVSWVFTHLIGKSLLLNIYRILHVQYNAISMHNESRNCYTQLTIISY